LVLGTFAFHAKTRRTKRGVTVISTPPPRPIEYRMHGKSHIEEYNIILDRNAMHETVIFHTAACRLELFSYLVKNMGNFVGMVARMAEDG